MGQSRSWILLHWFRISELVQKWILKQMKLCFMFQTKIQIFEILFHTFTVFQIVLTKMELLFQDET